MSNKAFLIGVNTQGLQYSERDAALMKECLERYDYEITIPGKHKSSILEQLDNAVDGCKKVDTFIFYFSGHGLLKKGKLFLILDDDTSKEGNQIHIGDITTKIENCSANNKLIILDCCHAGSAHASWKLDSSEHYKIMTASERLEKSNEFEVLKAGFLTYHIWKALKRPPSDIVDAENKVKINSFFDWLVKQAEYQNGIHGSDKVPLPNLVGNLRYDFEIAIVKDFGKEFQSGLVQLPVQIGTDLPGMKWEDWPFPVQMALKRLEQHEYIQNYINLFEAFIHLHFICLASQFYWYLPKKLVSKPSGLIGAGISVLYESLVDTSCSGGAAWLERSAILSAACTQLEQSVTLPFKKLVDIIEPDKLEIEKKKNNEDGETIKNNPDHWYVKRGGKIWDILSSIVELSNKLSKDDEDFKFGDESISEPLDMIGCIFLPYHGLQLAMVSETMIDDNRQRQVGIHCYWENDHFLRVTQATQRHRMEKIWKLPPPPGTKLLPAPKPPCAEWEWDESLLIYDPEEPYDKYVYLMPLGSRYRHRDAQQDILLPGLLDSVRWKHERVASVVQRTYQEPPQTGLEQDPPEAFAQVEGINKCIEELCRNFSFELPDSTATPEIIRAQFDLQHDSIAMQLAGDTVERPQEIERVLTALKESPGHRLLLEGSSGSGKSVLMAQIYQVERTCAVFVSMDAKPEPLDEPRMVEELQEAASVTKGRRKKSFLPSSKKNKASIALRVGMHCLSVLNRLMHLPQPNHVLSLAEVQDALRDNLAYFTERSPDTYFFILVDGLNQAPDPNGIFGGLPDPLPENLFVLASSQPQGRVRQPLNIYSQKSWELTDIAKLLQAEAAAIVFHYWAQEIEEQDTPAHSDLPEGIVHSLCKTGSNLPIFLQDWTKRLRQEWQNDPNNFAIHAEKDFQQYHMTLLPEFLRERFEKAVGEFEPSHLIEGLLWCFSLIQRALSINELKEAVETLRQQDLLDDLPYISKQEIEDGLSCLGGFLRQMKTGFCKRWQLTHEILGYWFVEQYGHPETLPNLRLSLVPLGAIPLPDKSSDAEFDQWLKWLKIRDYGPFESLRPELQTSVCESLLAYLPENSADYIYALVESCFLFLHETGEKKRVLALEPALEKALQQYSVQDSLKVEILQCIGDIREKNDEVDEALKYFKRSLSLSKKLEVVTSRDKREIGYTLSRIGRIYVYPKEKLGRALEYFEGALRSHKQLLEESSILKNRQNVAGALLDIGKVYDSQNKFFQALEHLKRSLRLFEQLLSESSSVLNRSNVAITLLSIGNVYSSQKQFDEALEYLERSLELYEGLLSESSSALNRSNVAITLLSIGNVYSSQKQLDKALEYLERSLELYEGLLSESSSVLNRSDLAVILHSIGDVYSARDQFDKALEYFERSLELYEGLLSESSSALNRSNVAITLLSIGNVYSSQKQLDEALEYLERSLELYEGLLSESSSALNRSNVAITLLSIGNVYSSQKQLDKAVEYLDRSLELHEGLLSESSSVLNRSDLAVILHSIGDVYSARDQFDKALEYFERSLELYEGLLSESSSVLNRSNVAITLLSIGNVYSSQKQFDEALEYFDRSLELYEGLLSESSSVLNRSNVAITLLSIGNVYSSQKQFDEALEYFDRSLELHEGLLSESSSVLNRSDLAVILHSIGDVYSARDQFDKALEYFDRSLELHEGLLSESSSVLNRSNVAITLLSIGNVYSSQKQFDKALEYFDRSLELYEGLLSESSSASNRSDLAVILHSIGDVYSARDQFDKAVEYLDRSLELKEELLAEAPMEDNQRSVIYVAKSFGDIYFDEGELDNAVKSYLRALELSEPLLTSEDSPENRTDVIIPITRLGEICRIQDQADQALGYFERSLDLCERQLAEAPMEDNQRSVIYVAKSLGDIYFDEGELDNAVKSYLRALELSEPLLTSEDSPENRTDVIIPITRLGEICRIQDQADQALGYFERSLDLCERQLAEAPMEDNQRSVIYVAKSLGDIYFDEGELDNAVKSYLRALELSEPLLTSEDSPENRTDVIIPITRLGEICRIQDQADQALGYFERSLDLCERQLAEAPMEDNQRSVIYVAKSLGDIYFDEGELDNAVKSYLRALELSEPLLTSEDSPENRTDVIIPITRLGEICRIQDQADQALGYFERSLDLCERQLAEAPMEDNQRSVIYVAKSLGDIYFDEGELDNAVKSYLRALELSEPLLTSEDSPENRTDVIIPITRLGEICRIQDQADQALDYFERSLDLCERQLAEAPMEDNQRSVIYVAKSLGDIYFDEGELDNAVKSYLRALELSEPLLTSEDSPENRTDVIIPITRLGEICRIQDQADQALGYFERSLDLCERQLAEAPMEDNQRSVIYVAKSLGDIYFDEGELDNAVKSYLRALELSEPLLTSEDSPENRTDVIIPITRLGEICRIQDQADQALDYFERSLDLCERQLAEAPMEDNQRSVIYVAKSLGDIYFDEGELDNAVKSYLRALELSEPLLTSEDSPENRTDVIIPITRLGEICRIQDQADQALDYFERSLDLCERQLAEAPMEDNQRSVIYVAKSLGNLYFSRNQFQKSLDYFQRSLTICERLFKKSKTLQNKMEFYSVLGQLTTVQRNLKQNGVAIAQQPWSFDVWNLFIRQVWDKLTSRQQDDLLALLPQSREIKGSLAGNIVEARPSLGIIIAACKCVQRTPLLYSLIDFSWWQKKFASQKQCYEHEQLEILESCKKDWGIAWTSLQSVAGGVTDDLKISDKHLSMSDNKPSDITLMLRTKQQIIENCPILSLKEVEQLL